jgi:hypothetical protein
VQRDGGVGIPGDAVGRRGEQVADAGVDVGAGIEDNALRPCQDCTRDERAAVGGRVETSRSGISA